MKSRIIIILICFPSILHAASDSQQPSKATATENPYGLHELKVKDKDGKIYTVPEWREKMEREKTPCQRAKDAYKKEGTWAQAVAIEDACKE